MKLDIRLNQWGGKRKGAGRPNLTGTVSHAKRKPITFSKPLHITLKLREKLPTIRNYTLFKEFKRSLQCAQKQGLFIIHFSIQHNHIHLFVETKNNRTLALGMRSLAGRFAKFMRAYTHKRSLGSKRGSIFKGRYHLHILRTPIEVKNALKYILLNTSKHSKLIEHIDPYSSGIFFTEWKVLLKSHSHSLIKEDAMFWKKNFITNGLANYEMVEWGISHPRTWLSQAGWMQV